MELTPKTLYSEVVKLAEVRYGYKLLPKKMGQLKFLKSSSGKFSVLRDICLAIGIQINF